MCAGVRLPLHPLLGAGPGRECVPSPGSPQGLRFPMEGWRERAELSHLRIATSNITPFSQEKILSLGGLFKG